MFDFINLIDLSFAVKAITAIILIILGFKVVNKVLKIILKLLGIILLAVLIGKMLGLI